MAIPLPLLLLMAGSQGASAAAGSIQASKARKSEEELSREKLALEREQGNQQTALQESTLDPFRQQMAQAGDMAKLDLLANASYTPTHVTPAARYASYVPQVSGGFSYQPSADVRAGAAKLKSSVMAGRGAPSATAPANYGKTSALNLFGTADPTTDAAFATGAPDRTNLAPPAAPVLDQPYRGGTDSALGKLAQGNANLRRQKQIAAFEAANPGWTVDPQTGQVIRKFGA
jgi:hypothetical protein